MPRLEKVAKDIGDAAGVAEVDALDERAVADHADAVASDAGGTTCAAIETMTQRLAVELGPSGVRVNCLRAHLIADAPSHGSYTGELIVGGPPQRASASSSGSGGGRGT
jgi:hypothetical protein